MSAPSTIRPAKAKQLPHPSDDTGLTALFAQSGSEVSYQLLDQLGHFRISAQCFGVTTSISLSPSFLVRSSFRSFKFVVVIEYTIDAI